VAKIIKLSTFKDERGSLTVLEKNIPFEIKRVFYIYNVDDSKRGFHKHKNTRQIAICISGSCDIIIENKKQQTYTLDCQDKGLLIEPKDFHWMENFTKDSILLVLASELYDENDYIYEN